MTSDVEKPRPRLAMSINEAAVEAGIGRDGIYTAIREGRLQAVKLGRRTLVTAEALQAYLNGLPKVRLPPKPEQEGQA